MCINPTPKFKSSANSIKNMTHTIKCWRKGSEKNMWKKQAVMYIATLPYSEDSVQVAQVYIARVCAASSGSIQTNLKVTCIHCSLWKEENAITAKTHTHIHMCTNKNWISVPGDDNSGGAGFLESDTWHMAALTTYLSIVWQTANRQQNRFTGRIHMCTFSQ